MKSWQNNVLLSNLFLAQNNEIKKDLTNKNILMKNSSFDSSFNSVQSINTNLPYLKLKKENKNINNHIIFAIVRASRSIRVSRDHLRLIRIFKILNLNSLVKTGVDAVLANKELSIAQLASLKNFKLITKLFSKNFTEFNLVASNLNFSNSNLSLPKTGHKILNSNLLLRNRKFDLLRSNLAVILKKRIKIFSEIFTACLPPKDANITYFNSAETYKLLYIFFKSMYCLISKPVFKYTNDKVIIQLFYYLNIPRKKIFRLFSIFYINSIKKKWLTSLVCSVNRQKNNDSSNLVTRRFVSNKIYIRLRVRKAISRLKNKLNLNLLFKLRKLNLN